MNLVSAFDERVASAPNHPAILGGDRILSYADLAAMSRDTATALQDRGVRPGDRVALWLKNSPDYAAVLIGILRLGAVVVPVNTFLKPAEVKQLLFDAGVNLLVSDSSLERHFPELLTALPPLRVVAVNELVAESGREVLLPAPSTRVSDLALLIYTSGTTGRPKGVMLSHGNLLHNVESCRKALDAQPSDRVIVLLPMFHSFMLCVGIFLPLLVGCSMVLIRSLHPPKATVEEILLHRGTILPAIPQFFRALAGLPEGVQLPLRVCISGAAPLPVRVIEEFQRRFSVPLLEGYGLSEASPVVSLNPIAGPWKAGSIGRPVPDVEVSVQDESGSQLAIGEVGEISVRGGNVMAGYWHQPEETARTLRKGWLLTGDMGYCDADGYFFVTDRKKDMLLVNGNNVYPREIEELLYQFPGIREAAVVGVTDRRKGEQPVAFVAVDDGTTLDAHALRSFVRQRLADYKVPKKVIQLPALPRNATGKILKTALRELAASPGGR